MKDVVNVVVVVVVPVTVFVEVKSNFFCLLQETHHIMFQPSGHTKSSL